MQDIPYFLDYKRHPTQIWEENGGVSYSPNAAYLARFRGRGAGGAAVERDFFPIFLL